MCQCMRTCLSGGRSQFQIIGLVLRSIWRAKHPALDIWCNADDTKVKVKKRQHRVYEEALSIIGHLVVLGHTRFKVKLLGSSVWETNNNWTN